MKSFFGYIYYRVAEHLISVGKNDGIAVGALSLTQSLLIAFLVDTLIKALSSHSNFKSYNSYSGYLFLTMLLILFVINFCIHVTKYNDYEHRWGNENFKTRFLKGILVIVFLLSPLLSLWYLQYQPWF